MTLSTDQIAQLQHRINDAVPSLKVVLGAGIINYGRAWIPTNMEELDVTRHEDWETLFQKRRIDNLFCEHVWEHLTLEETHVANKLAFQYLKPGGRFRIAVPDGLHPDPKYINYVKPGGTGAGAEDHKILYDFTTLGRSLQEWGFKIEYLEYWDGDGNFNYNEWDVRHGKVLRSLHFDERNTVSGKPNYTSLIIDAIKPM